MFQVTTDSNLRSGKPGDFRIRDVPDERLGDACDHPGCGSLAFFYLESRNVARFCGRRACSEHAESWWERKTNPPMNEPKPKRPPGRPPSPEKKARMHVTLGELSLEILASHLAADSGFNHSRFIDEAIRFAQASPAFQERLKKH